MPFRSLNDPCRGSREEPDGDWPDRTIEAPPSDPSCGCCGAPEGQPCDAAAHEDYERAWSEAWEADAAALRSDWQALLGTECLAAIVSGS